MPLWGIIIWWYYNNSTIEQFRDVEIMDLSSKFNQSLDLSGPRNRRVAHISDILWIQSGQVPPFYTQLAHFVTVESVGISTPILYKILESSGLTNTILASIWSLCNQVELFESSTGI